MTIATGGAVVDGLASETDPWRQVSDIRAAVSYVRNFPHLNPARIGFWGTSYAGGHVLTVSALDQRVKAAVAQVPLVSGSRTFDNWVPAKKRTAFIQRLLEDHDARMRGEVPAVTRAAHSGSETAEWLATNDLTGAYRNELTLQSLDLLRSYEPIAFAEQISSKPLRMIVANRDTQTPTPWQLEAFAQISGPKKFVQLDCRHYDVSMSQQVEAVSATAAWFEEHL